MGSDDSASPASSRRQTVLVFPAWDDNPYLELLAAVPTARGTRFVSALTWQDALARSAALSAGDVFHLHWTAPVMEHAAGAADARARVQRFEALVDDLRRRRVALVWTVHNRVPHEVVFEREEHDLTRLLAERADAIHIMAPGTPDVLSPLVSLDPTRTHLIAHPHYATRYPRTDSTLARASFGLADEQFAVLHVGNLRPYKGLDVLFAAIAQAASMMEREPVLLLTGHADPRTARETTAGLPAGIRAVTDYRFTTPEELSRWVAASDVVALPYRAILNSGSVHLAGSLHRPAIMPREPHLQQQFARYPWVSFFDPAAADSSLAAAIASASRRDQTGPDLYRRFLRDSDPERISQRYDRLLQRVRPRPGSGE